MAKSPSTYSKILIVGCGSIGGVIACSLLEAGLDIAIVATNDEVRTQWREGGQRLNGRLLAAQLSKENIFSSLQTVHGRFALVYVAVQALQVHEVAEQLLDVLEKGGHVVCLPNGLSDARMGAILGDERVIGAVVSWGASMPRPGHYVQTSSGGFTIGSLRGHDAHALQVLALQLEHIGPVKQTTNLRGARLSKLAINCAITALGTIGGSTLGKLLLSTHVRKLGLALMREAVAVAVADGVRLEPVNKIDIAKLVSAAPSGRRLKKAAQHALLLAVGTRYRRLRSSMLAAIERGRTPAIDYINGEIVSLGKKRGISVPYNQAAVEIIWQISRGELSPGKAALHEFARRAQELN